MLDKLPAFYPEIISTFSSAGKLVLDTIQKADRLANVTFNKIISIKKSDWTSLLSYIDKLNFRDSPSLDPEIDGSADGANWVLEAVKESRYHFIDRRNPLGNLRDLGKYLIKLGNLSIPEDEIY